MVIPELVRKDIVVILLNEKGLLENLEKELSACDLHRQLERCSRATQA